MQKKEAHINCLKDYNYLETFKVRALDREENEEGRVYTIHKIYLYL